MNAVVLTVLFWLAGNAVAMTEVFATDAACHEAAAAAVTMDAVLAVDCRWVTLGDTELRVVLGERV
jgi:hypothetical protein